MSVLVLTEAADIVGAVLPDWLRAEGIEGVHLVYTDRIDTWPGWTLRADTPGGALHLPTGDLDLASLSSVWLHRLMPRTPEAWEALAPLVDVLEAMPLFVLDRTAPRDHTRYKLLVHELAQELGLRVPRTFLGNGGARTFAAGPLIFKTLAGSASADMKGLGGVLTRRVKPGQLDHDASIQLCPILLQEEIPRAAEVRAIVVDGQVFCAELPVHDSDLDWRRLGPAQVDLWRACELPADVTRALVDLHARLGLRFGAADLLRTPEGEHVFLETNTTGGFWWVSELHGGAALRAILALLRAPPALSPHRLSEAPRATAIEGRTDMPPGRPR
jgi:glutathione synthase/RimK-type ligase-like ATP-grasp enzyme